LFKLFSKKPARSDAATELYAAVVAQARNEVFFLECEVPDTVDGRFDLVLLHAFLLFHRLKADHEATKELGQEVFDLMFENLDQNLRELGVGDMGIGRRIKGMAQAFYGRVQSYEEALEAGDEHRLEDALRRNLFRKCEPAETSVKTVSAYVFESSKNLDAIPVQQIAAGKIDFGSPPTGGN